MKKCYLLSAEEMKSCDRRTTDIFLVPSLVLMERAALCVAEEIEKRFVKGGKVLIVAGCGNNGGDGIAAGRILRQHGFAVDFVLIGNREKWTEQMGRQVEIAEKYGCLMQSKIENEEYDIVVDALFGIGLSKKAEGAFAECIGKINAMKAFVCSVDIPSGIHADTGEVMGAAVEAELTVTFAYAKLGHMLYPGCMYAGELVIRDIGITEDGFGGRMPKVYTFRQEIKEGMPKREKSGNKGTFGKVLVIAGSLNMSGASELCAKSVYRVGAGMVKVVAPEENRIILQSDVPEALLTTYSSGEQTDLEEIKQKLEKDMEWADCIVAGPGIGKNSEAVFLVKQVLSGTEKPLVLDADGLNLLAGSAELKEALVKREGPVILTPHVAECARLYGCTTEEMKKSLFTKPRELADRWNCVVVCKDARTVVAFPKEEMLYLNTTGNDGMAAAGSGDVLAGMITGLLAQGMEAGEAAAFGVYLHGTAGDCAAACTGKYAVMAGDLVEQLKYILEGNRNGKGTEK